jgi:hypothetical protein
MSLSTDQFIELLSGGRETRGVEFKAAGLRGDPLKVMFPPMYLFVVNPFNIDQRCGASSELDSSPFATSVACDWRDQSGWWPVRDGEKWEANSAIGIGHIVQMLLQMFLLAGRMAESAAGAEKLDIEISLAPTLGRELFSDFPRRMLLPGYKADIDRIRLPIDVTRTELLASVDDLTTATANRVFGGERSGTRSFDALPDRRNRS